MEFRVTEFYLWFLLCDIFAPFIIYSWLKPAHTHLEVEKAIKIDARKMESRWIYCLVARYLWLAGAHTQIPHVECISLISAKWNGSIHQFVQFEIERSFKRNLHCKRASAAQTIFATVFFSSLHQHKRHSDMWSRVAVRLWAKLHNQP